jgi:hypothetical protein
MGFLGMGFLRFEFPLTGAPLPGASLRICEGFRQSMRAFILGRTMGSFRNGIRRSRSRDYARAEPNKKGQAIFS